MRCVPLVLLILCACTPKSPHESAGQANVAPASLRPFIAESVAQGKVPVVYVYADWCSPCKKLSAAMDSDQKFQQLLSEQLNLRKVNFDDDAELVEALGVHNIPQLLLFNADGTEKGRVRHTRAMSVHNAEQVQSRLLEVNASSNILEQYLSQWEEKKARTPALAAQIMEEFKDRANDAAVKHWMHVVEQMADSAAAVPAHILMTLGDYKLHTDDEAGALRHYDRIIHSESSGEQAVIFAVQAKMRIFFRNDKKDEAMTLMQSLLSRFPQSELATMTFVIFSLEHEVLMKEAIAVAEKALASSPHEQLERWLKKLREKL